MTELLPGTQAPAVQESILDYLSTTFALADEDARATLLEFLADRENGIFKGPYLRVRLPFKAAAEGWRDALEWYEGFPPYGHQAAAFARLSSLDLGEDKPRPLPTLVTTGTGSGKTEAFLYPILDHVLRAKRRGVTGTKALILYPMNALANDQAQRLAGILTSHAELSGVTAALYTGEEGPKRTVVSAAGLITDRTVIRDSPPDILLTNYKMLDQMLLRTSDAGIWAKSASSLQYLVLDEFHTYDGAQGTDVSMLLRRFGLALKSHWPEDGPFTDADRARPLGIITPVATSATLGDRGDPAAMLGFAQTVFGEEFAADSVVTESRLSLEEWVAGATTAFTPRTDRDAVNTAVEAGGRETDGRRIAEVVLACLFADDAGAAPILAKTTADELLDMTKIHPFTRALVTAAERAQSLPDLVAAVLPTYAEDDASLRLAEEFLLLLSAALSHVRKAAGRDALSVDLHLWVRELSRIDRVATGTPEYHWSDDRHLGDESTESGSNLALPAIYCRHCGRSGWGAQRAPVGGFDLTAADANEIRQARLRDDQEFRALIYAPAEADAIGPTGAPSHASDPDEPRLLWFHVGERRLLAERPDEDAEEAAGRLLPVLTHDGPEAGKRSTDDVCPSCLQKDGIRFLGSAIATLLSVSLSTIFGSDDLDKAEKKTLVFTDSVQDAAHRAGFVQSRSHRLTLRAILRGAVGDDPVSLDLLVDRVLQQAADDQHRRYRILPPDFADRDEFAEFWRRPKQSQVPAKVRRRVKRRFLLDTVLEFGLQAQLGRTLELTGSLAAMVDISHATLLKAATEVEKSVGPEHFEGMGLTDAQRVGWVRGVLEKMRTDGAIAHEWFRKYQSEDGNRWSLTGGRPRADGMPAFPVTRTGRTGRPAPAYPRVGGANNRGSDMVPVASTKSWYAVWTARTLTCTPAEGATLATALLKQLASMDVLTAVNTASGGQVYELPQAGILVEPVGDLPYVDGRHLLACDVCGALVPGTAQVINELDSLPCFVVRCPGRLERRTGRADNFYRRLYQASDITRVVAREHTSLLPDATRLAYETKFKGSATDPQAPNVLVATPTLEMGIDIGDLSTVMLASLPRSVASYLQRVGRAGRLTGSALNFAFVSGRGEQLPRLGEPLSVINGQVRPPATYLDAEEILRRQYLASVADMLARRADAPHPASATEAIGSVEPGSYLHELILGAESGTSLEHFLSGFDTLSEDARNRLKAWATPESGKAGTSTLSVHVHEQRHRWSNQVETLKHRIQEIKAEIPELQARAGAAGAGDDDRVALRTAVAAVRLAEAQLDALSGVNAYWISVLEEYGLLPNYTLLDDSVTLDVTLSWIDPDTQEYMTEPASFSRGASLALREFAPGATFYGRGSKIQIDAVDLGTDGEAIQEWTFCPSCGYSRAAGDGGPLTTCPRCGDAGIADVRQTLDVVDLQRVSSAMRREEASIDDGRDDRERVNFQVVTAADIGAPRDQWYVDGQQFGLKHLTKMSIRWLNLGRAAEPGAGPRLIAGEEYAAPLFRVCSRCGKLDTRTGGNAASEHRPWCALRKATKEDTRSVALSRSLTTEGIVIELPAVISVGDRFAVPSLMAALQLGLREHLGGAPDHLAIEEIRDPHLSDGSENRDALLIHDTVPGGTGYLAELASPEKFYAVLHRAWTVVRDCPCQDENRAACHRCLMPFISSSAQRYVSRLAAERHLRSILLGGNEGEPTEAMPWIVVPVSTASYDPESHIEQKFRTLLHDRLTNGLGASVTEKPGPYGNRWTINPGGGATWTMEPQLQLGGVQPDFVFVSSNQSVPRVAVFCDGWQFHANPTINNLTADAKKRASLRTQGYVVIGLTWADLVASEEKSVTLPSWFSDAKWTQAMKQSAGLKPGHADLVRGGPIDFLVRWISKPDPDGVRALAEALPLLLVGAGAHGKLSGDESLTVAARHLHDGQALASVGERQAWSWQSDTLTVLARHLGQGTATDIAVLIDDRTEHLGQQHKAAWNDWLRLSNLLNLRIQDAHITTYSLAGVTTPAIATAEPAAVGLEEPWKSIRELTTVPEVRDLITALAHAGVATPVPGFETPDGAPIEIAWPDFQIAVDIDLEDIDRDELDRMGWTVVAVDLEQIKSALAGAGTGVK